MNATDESNVLRDGDAVFTGVNQRLAPDRVPAGFVANAVNARFRDGQAVTRGGISVRWIGPEGQPWAPYGYPQGAIDYRTSDGQQWIITAAGNRVFRAKTHQTGEVIPLPAGTVLPSDVQFCQAGNSLYLFGGASFTPLELRDGDFTTGFQAITQTTSGSGNGTGTLTIPNGKQAIFFQERLWGVTDAGIYVSDVRNFTRYSLLNAFRIESGAQDELLCVYPYGDNSIIAFKSRSVHARYGWTPNASGDLTATQGQVLSNTHGLVGINAVTQAGADIFYFSTLGLTSVRLSEEGRLTSTDIPLDQDMRDLWRRINWKFAGRSALAYVDSKLYWSLPVDGSEVCNCVAVYDLQTRTWQGTDEGVGLEQGVVRFLRPDYLGALRLWFIDTRGHWRIYEEGEHDIRVGNYRLTEDGRRRLTEWGTPRMTEELTPYADAITTTLTTRGYIAGTTQVKRFNQVRCTVQTRNPNLAVRANFSPQSAGTRLTFPAYTTSRTKRRGAFAGAWNASNANDDFNDAGREDYTLVLPAGGMALGSGVYLNRRQEKILTGRTTGETRYLQLRLTNTSGTLALSDVEVEGYRGNSRGGR